MKVGEAPPADTIRVKYFLLEWNEHYTHEIYEH